MSENSYTTWQYFNLFTPQTFRIKDKSAIGVQMVYSCISNCLLLAEKEVYCSLYSGIITYSIIYIYIYVFINTLCYTSTNLYIYIHIYIYTHTHTHTHTNIYIYIWVCLCVCVYVCRINIHRNTRHYKSHVQLVGSEPQCALVQYIILTAKALIFIHHNMQFL